MAQLDSRVSLLLSPPAAAPGWQQLLSPASPAAGQPWVRQVPGETWERYVSVSADLTTSAVVANRQPRLRLLDEAGVMIASVDGSGLIPAATTVRCRWMLGVGWTPTDTSGHSDGGMFDILAQPGWQLQVYVAAMDAGDQLTIHRVLAQRFPSDVISTILGA